MLAYAVVCRPKWLDVVPTPADLASKTREGQGYWDGDVFQICMVEATVQGKEYVFSFEILNPAGIGFLSGTKGLHKPQIRVPKYWKTCIRVLIRTLKPGSVSIWQVSVFLHYKKNKLYYYKEKKITPAWLNQAGVSTSVVVQQVNGAALLVQKYEYGHLRYVFSFGLLN
jgi:hypothetical protein